MRMFRIALKSLKARWVSLLGAFLALALGVAMTAVMLLGLAAAAGHPAGRSWSRWWPRSVRPAG